MHVFDAGYHVSLEILNTVLVVKIMCYRGKDDYGKEELFRQSAEVDGEEEYASVNHSGLRGIHSCQHEVWEVGIVEVIGPGYKLL